MTEENSAISKKRLIPLVDWPKHHAWPPLGGLRHLVFHADKNGFNKVIKRASKRVLIDEEAFFKWVEANNKNEEEVNRG